MSTTSRESPIHGRPIPLTSPESLICSNDIQQIVQLLASVIANRIVVDHGAFTMSPQEVPDQAEFYQAWIPIHSVILQDIHGQFSPFTRNMLEETRVVVHGRSPTNREKLTACWKKILLITENFPCTMRRLLRDETLVEQAIPSHGTADRANVEATQRIWLNCLVNNDHLIPQRWQLIASDVLMRLYRQQVIVAARFSFRMLQKKLYMFAHEQVGVQQGRSPMGRDHLKLELNNAMARLEIVHSGILVDDHNESSDILRDDLSVDFSDPGNASTASDSEVSGPLARDFARGAFHVAGQDNGISSYPTGQQNHRSDGVQTNGIHRANGLATGSHDREINGNSIPQMSLNSGS